MSDRALITVAVCTNQCPNRVAATAAALRALRYPRERLDLVLALSGRETGARSRDFGDWPGRLLLVPESGLSRARNAVVEQARGELVAFLDDDVVPAPDWLEALLAVLATFCADAVGGPVRAQLEEPIPPWLAGCFLPYLAVWRPAETPCLLRGDDHPRGANMAFRREAFRMIGPFDLSLGRRGRSLLACEETEWFARLRRAGGRIAYAPAAEVRHRIARERLARGWMLRRICMQGASEALIARRAGAASWRQALGKLWASAAVGKPVYGRWHRLHIRARRGAVAAFLAASACPVFSANAQSDPPRH